MSTNNEIYDLETDRLRLKFLMAIECLNQSQFAKRIGIKQSNLSEILSGKRPIGSNIINKLIISFGINPEWITTGRGEMYNKDIAKDTTIHDNALWERIEELAISLFTPNNEKTSSFIDYEAMEIATNIAAPRLYSIIQENQFPTYTELLSIANSESLNISSEWLLIGKGSMFKLGEPIIETYPQQTTNKNAIKYYPSVNGSIGGIEFLDNPDETSLDIILPGFSDCKFAINAFGDSMFPVIKSGQVVLLMEWKESFIDWGHIYLVITKNGYRAIKYLKPSSQEGFIKCESENKESSPAFDVEINDIHKLFLVKGWVCRDVI